MRTPPSISGHYFWWLLLVPAALSLSDFLINTDSDARRLRIMGTPMILRTAFVIAVLMALGGVLSACGFSNTFNYGHGQGACENCGDEQ
jgi:hypothetical protein